MNGIDGKAIVITGASSGIGAATARLLAERGAIVVLGARRAGRLDDIAREIRECGGAALTCPTDVTAAMTLDRLVGAAVGEFGRLDVLVSNVGVPPSGPGPFRDGGVISPSAPRFRASGVTRGSEFAALVGQDDGQRGRRYTVWTSARAASMST